MLMTLTPSDFQAALRLYVSTLTGNAIPENTEIVINLENKTATVDLQLSMPTPKKRGRKAKNEVDQDTSTEKDSPMRVSNSLSDLAEEVSDEPVTQNQEDTDILF